MMVGLGRVKGNWRPCLLKSWDLIPVGLEESVGTDAERSQRLVHGRRKYPGPLQRKEAILRKLTPGVLTTDDHELRNLDAT